MADSGDDQMAMADVEKAQLRDQRTSANTNVPRVRDSSYSGSYSRTSIVKAAPRKVHRDSGGQSRRTR